MVIAAEQLNTLVKMRSGQLTGILHQSGHRGHSISRARFLGLTNGGQFCYEVLCKNNSSNTREKTKVFVNCNQGQLTAGF